VKYKRIIASTWGIFHCSFKCQSHINLQWCNDSCWCYGSVYCVLKYLVQYTFFRHFSPFLSSWLNPGAGEWFIHKLQNSALFEDNVSHLATLVHFAVLKIKVEIKKRIFKVRVSLRLVAQILKTALPIWSKWVSVHPTHFSDEVRKSLSLHRASWYKCLCSPTDALIY
jgi:hypothetical protein